ncbi:NitT/TauT family transport system substrate-binding protein [Loktanella fryxellensis]|uniref:NitT/TauT family transport system substrate-binding protein n=1 Tax=Loktanella fryxellensis TaxID=245187 RepID=A0A1H8IXJ1_9RHOB|nr:ABC transporter substrate-binding protein [Loktanella fryxellensis]SEN72418.1 NitT/TauT family transport system substrate-binding protein [Loktanella fryxellensis]
MTRLMLLTRRTFAGLAGTTALVAGFGLATPLMAQTNLTVAVPNPSAITWLPMWAAIGEGYFEEEGLTLQVEAVDGSGQVIQAMAAGQAQIGAPGPGPVLAARSRGVDVKFIYNLYPKSVFGILVPSDSDYQTPEDLRDTTIGVGTADGAEVSFARAIFSDLGMEQDTNYTFLPVGDGGTAAVGFMRGDVAGYVGAVSDAAILASRGMDLREITPEEYLAFFGNGFAVMQEFIDANPEMIEGFGRAMVHGMEFAGDPANLEAALDHAAAGNAQEGEDREFAGALLVAAHERMTPTDAYIEQGFGYQPPEHWEAWHESLLASGDLSAPLDDLEAAYTNEFVEAWNQ